MRLIVGGIGSKMLNHQKVHQSDTSMTTLLIDEPSTTESDSFSEHYNSSDDSGDRLSDLSW